MRTEIFLSTVALCVDLTDRVVSWPIMMVLSSQGSQVKVGCAGTSAPSESKEKEVPGPIISNMLDFCP